MIQQKNKVVKGHEHLIKANIFSINEMRRLNSINICSGTIYRARAPRG
jgi:hypothetical protein